MDYDNHQWQTTDLIRVLPAGRFHLMGTNNINLIIMYLQLDNAKTYVCIAIIKLLQKQKLEHISLFIVHCMYMYSICQ